MPPGSQLLHKHQTVDLNVSKVHSHMDEGHSDLHTVYGQWPSWPGDSYHIKLCCTAFMYAASCIQQFQQRAYCATFQRLQVFWPLLPVVTGVQCKRQQPADSSIMHDNAPASVRPGLMRGTCELRTGAAACAFNALTMHPHVMPR
jgi:hypothetical protein